MATDHPPAARDIIAGVLDRDALGAEPRGTPYEEADRIVAALDAQGLLRDPDGAHG